MNDLRNLLNEWDFTGVFDPDINVDEYDCMIAPLLSRLRAGADSTGIQQYLDAEMTDHFGLLPNPAETEAAAGRITSW